MKLIALFIALFVFFFGSVIAMKVFEVGLQVGQKAAQVVGKILIWPFACLYQILCLKTEKYRVIIDEDVLGHEQAQKRISSSRRPVTLEHVQELNLLQTIKARALTRKN